MCFICFSTDSLARCLNWNLLEFDEQYTLLNSRKHITCSRCFEFSYCSNIKKKQKTTPWQYHLCHQYQQDVITIYTNIVITVILSIISSITMVAVRTVIISIVSASKAIHQYHLRILSISIALPSVATTSSVSVTYRNFIFLITVPSTTIITYHH